MATKQNATWTFELRILGFPLKAGIATSRKRAIDSLIEEARSKGVTKLTRLRDELYRSSRFQCGNTLTIYKVDELMDGG